jgi:hypothetical protein
MAGAQRRKCKRWQRLESAMRITSRTPRERRFRMKRGQRFRMREATTKQLLLKTLHRFTYFLPAATCQSGYGAVCKTVYPGSIPGVASKKIKDLAVQEIPLVGWLAILRSSRS